MRFSIFVLILILSSCTAIEVEENPLFFFWEEMDKKYVFFEDKQIDWDSVKRTLYTYDPGIKTDLVSGFSSMIIPLQDRHVWVNTGETYITYSPQHDFAIVNLKPYLPSKIEENTIFSIVQLSEKIVYIEIRTFASSFIQLEEKLVNYDYSNGIIMDIRRNQGGSPDVILELASYFISGKHVVLYQKYKKGRGHNDFTKHKPISLEGNNLFGDAKIILLIDKLTYSSANLFASIMKEFTGAILVGNNTGGGGASSVKGVLPNGWGYSLSQEPYFDINFNSLESGVSPHYFIMFDKEQYEQQNQRHNQMEFAYKLLTNEY